MSTPGAAVRVAGIADLEALLATRVALFRELGEGPTEAEREAFVLACRDALGVVLRDGRAAAWVALAGDGSVCGSAILLEFPRLPSPRNLRDREGYALNVYVAPEARRQGFATALVAAAVAEGERRGLARIRLHATPSGRTVYARLGFHGREDEMERTL